MNPSLYILVVGLVSRNPNFSMNKRKRKLRQGEAVRHVPQSQVRSDSNIRTLAFESNAGKVKSSSGTLNMDSERTSSVASSSALINVEMPDAQPPKPRSGNTFESEFPFDSAFIDEIAALEPDPERREKYASVWAPLGASPNIVLPGSHRYHIG